jgi:hypothetical protein
MRMTSLVVQSPHTRWTAAPRRSQIAGQTGAPPIRTRRIALIERSDECKRLPFGSLRAVVLSAE